MTDTFEKRANFQKTAEISSAALKDINWRVKVSFYLLITTVFSTSFFCIILCIFFILLY